MSHQSERSQKVYAGSKNPSTSLKAEDAKVILIGCGPTGTLLSALLGRLSVSNIVPQKETEIVQDLRGIAVDEDGIRLLQELGLYDKIYSDIGQSIGWLHLRLVNTGSVPSLFYESTSTLQKVVQDMSEQSATANQ